RRGQSCRRAASRPGCCLSRPHISRPVSHIKTKNMEAYIIAGYRTAVGKAPRGVFRFTRADDLAAEVVRHLVASVPNLDNEQIDDVIVGNATPEAEQGLNIGRMIS